MRGKKKGCRAEMSDSISTLGATRQDIFTKKKRKKKKLTGKTVKYRPI